MRDGRRGPGAIDAISSGATSRLPLDRRAGGVCALEDEDARASYERALPLPVRSRSDGCSSGG